MRTVRVRIAVAVGPKGFWGARGYADEAPEASAELISDRNDRIYYVEADLPIPEAVTVEGKMSEG